MERIQDIIQKLLVLPDGDIENAGKLLSGKCNEIEDAYEPVDDSDLIALYHKLENTPYEKEIWEVILFRYHWPLMEEIAVQLIQKNIGVCHLGHQRQHDRVQLMLVDLVDEALMTLGQEYYCSSRYSVDVFRQFIQEYEQSYSLLRHLLNKTPDNNEKHVMYMTCITHHEDADEFLTILRNQAIVRTLLQTDDEHFIQEKFREQQPMFWRAMSSNIHTPSTILERLSTITHVKYAKEIRHTANMTLRQKRQT